MAKQSNTLILNGYNSAISRWARFGPYYAMFPVKFAKSVISRYSSPGDCIIDPFAGRGTTVFVGGALKRKGIGIEINPVGWIYGQVKIKPAKIKSVQDRLMEIYLARINFGHEIEQLPEFFRYCFCEDVLLFLLSARTHLAWTSDMTDTTLMAFLLVYLHGKLGEGLSNQMRQTKAMSPNYSINWWIDNNLNVPPEINPYELILKKINWRYLKGAPSLRSCSIYKGDSTSLLPKIEAEMKQKKSKVSLIFTSPPYWSITNYHNDQWLRLWLLGGDTKPKMISEDSKNRFLSKEKYENLLNDVFSGCAKIAKRKCAVYVRTDAREFTFEKTLNSLKTYFPKHSIEIINRPYREKTKTQTQLFGDNSTKPGEKDIILTR